MTDSTVALILAGGSASRMGGGDKPLLRLGGQALLVWLKAALAPLTTAISANGDPERFAALGVPVLSDGPFTGQGPLAGILAGLDWADGLGADFLLTVPGDTPFIPGGLATGLAPAPACAASLGRVHHGVALWPVTVRVALRSLLSRPGPRGIHHFAATIGMRRVDFPAGKWDPFLNINTPEELTMARILLGRSRTEGAA